MAEMKHPELESIEGFLTRAVEAGVRELWVSIGSDRQSGLHVIHLSPRSNDTTATVQAVAAGITTRSFYVEGDTAIPCDGQVTFSEAVMRSNMTDAQKIDWLYTTCREHEARLMEAEACPT